MRMSAPSVPDAPGQLEILAGLVAARVAEILAAPEEWLDKAAVMERTRFAATVISKAMNGVGDRPMHCHRRTEGGHPRVQPSVVSAWMAGASLEQQLQVCGCAKFHRWQS